MLTRKLDPQSFVHAYNVDLQVLYPWEGVVEPPFGAAWAVLAPGESTKPHAHQECETFFIARGRGIFAIGDEQVEVEPGDVTFHEPFHNHVLTNTSDEDLLFLTVYWEDKGRWAGGGDGHPGHDGPPGHHHRGEGEPAVGEERDAHPPRSASPPVAAAASVASRRIERELVTAAPPTPNGDLHLGHLAGPYLSADFHARFRRLQGVDAHFVVGSDDNSVYTKTRGAELGMEGGEAATHFTDLIEESLAMAGVATSAFPRPNASPHHRRLTRDFVRRLHERGALEEREVPTPFCAACDQFLFEAYVRGRCPHCGDGVLGQTCESCGRVYGAERVVDPACSLCGGTEVELRPLRRLFFPLARHADFLRDYYRRAAMNHHLRALVEGVLAEGPPDVAVTLPTDWGLEVPVEGYEDQRIYVWLEMAPRYFAYAQHVDDLQREAGTAGAGGEDAADAGWQRFWMAPEARVVQFFGYDNGFYYGMLLPALWHAYDPDLRLPEAFVTNEFYRLDGAKFSTTRNHRILARELLSEAPRDPVRFFLAWSAPEREQTNFTREEFHDVVRRELLESWEPWVESLGRRLAEGFDGTVPATGDWTPEHRRFYHRLEELRDQAAEAWAAESFSPQRAARLAAELVREARRFGAGERHWDGVPTRGEERRTGIALELVAARLLGLLVAPVMPETAERLWLALGEETGPEAASRPGAGTWDRGLDWLPAGTRPPVASAPAGGLFPGLGTYLDGR